MKKQICTALCILMVISMSGCGKSNDRKDVATRETETTSDTVNNEEQNITIDMIDEEMIRNDELVTNYVASHNGNTIEKIEHVSSYTVDRYKEIHCDLTYSCEYWEKTDVIELIFNLFDDGQWVTQELRCIDNPLINPDTTDENKYKYQFLNEVAYAIPPVEVQYGVSTQDVLNRMDLAYDASQSDSYDSFETYKATSNDGNASLSVEFEYGKLVGFYSRIYNVDEACAQEILNYVKSVVGDGYTESEGYLIWWDSIYGARLSLSIKDGCCEIFCDKKDWY